MHISRTIQIDWKVQTKDELDSFNSYIGSLVETIDHTPYTVSVEQTNDTDEEKL